MAEVHEGVVASGLALVGRHGAWASGAAELANVFDEGLDHSVVDQVGAGVVEHRHRAIDAGEAHLDIDVAADEHAQANQALAGIGFPADARAPVVEEVLVGKVVGFDHVFDLGEARVGGSDFGEAGNAEASGDVGERFMHVEFLLFDD